jgi:hypothetical protein
MRGRRNSRLEIFMGMFKTGIRRKNLLPLTMGRGKLVSESTPVGDGKFGILKAQDQRCWRCVHKFETRDYKFTYLKSQVI